MRIGKFRYQFHQNFQLAVMISMGLVALVGMIPFVIYRLVRAEWMAALIEITGISLMMVSVIYAWRTGNSRGPGLVIMYVSCIGALFLAMVIGQIALFWVYPLIVSSFFLVERRRAVVTVVIFLIVLLMTGLMTGRIFPSLLLGMSFTVTALLICFYTYIFAAQAEAQRQQLENLASRDMLTGAFNRRTFQQELQLAYQIFERGKTVCGLLILDLDHFKQINDTWGHDAGDEVLVRLTRLVESSVRKTDRVFRYGGEEFVLLVYPIRLSELQKMAENIRRQIEQNLSYEGRIITASIGGALLQKDESPEAWFSRADAALYRAKHQGRNRAVIDHVEEAIAPLSSGDVGA
ncbi:MAG: GGDEF domain-containing protein [Candidatus Competibacter sp.]|nr:GGDEF domain-containing protein [Candidatus Competibacter sp.]